MNQPQYLRLQYVEVESLFGVYNYHINLNLNDRVTLLHGQNGTGKTTILKMIDSLLRRDIAHFREIPFVRFILGFNDESTLELKAINGSKTNENICILKLERQNRESHSAEVKLQSEAEIVAQKVDHLRPHSDGYFRSWIDVRDYEELTEEDVISRYSVSDSEHRSQENLNWFDAFLESANTHFIEAQRLVRTHRNVREEVFLSRPARRASWWLPRVVECSRDFGNRLSNTMVDYGRQAQTLDQTFPQRLISATEELDYNELKQRMSDLDKRTEELKEIGILDVTPTHPFDVNRLSNMDHTQARVMTLYVQDTEGKLQALNDFAKRTRLLLESVNDKFRRKRILLDREKGLIAENEKGQRLALDSLSSGEQHELVLHYDLLFKVLPNTVVLIDEPELSLHVAWQKKFLPDLMDIVELSGFDAIMATHSPYIVSDRDDLMVGLDD